MGESGEWGESARSELGVLQMITREDSGSTAVLRMAHGKVSALDVDFSTLPPSLCKTILEGFEFQRDWLDVMSKRNARYLARWGPGLRERSKG